MLFCAYKIATHLCIGSLYEVKLHIILIHMVQCTEKYKQVVGFMHVSVVHATSPLQLVSPVDASTLQFTLLQGNGEILLNVFQKFASFFLDTFGIRQIPIVDQRFLVFHVDSLFFIHHNTAKCDLLLTRLFYLRKLLMLLTSCGTATF